MFIILCTFNVPVERCDTVEGPSGAHGGRYATEMGPELAPFCSISGDEGGNLRTKWAPRSHPPKRSLFNGYPEGAKSIESHNYAPPERSLGPI